MQNDRFTDDKATIHAELVKRAKARQTITYGEAAALVGRANQGLAPILNAIKAEETKNGKPDLGCLVVRSDTGLPGYVGSGPDAQTNAFAMRKAVFEAYRS